MSERGKSAQAREHASFPSKKVKTFHVVVMQNNGKEMHKKVFCN